jgi:hypothetical protein
MSQADSINTTSRRGFLTRGAATVAGASLLATPAFPIPAGADPIFDAIENHRSAYRTLKAACSEQSRLESILPGEKRKTCFTAWEETIVETDDPRWIEAERALSRSSDAETDAACVLVSIRPTTMAGVIALLRYATEADTDGVYWPEQLQSEDGNFERSWHYFLVENLAETVSDLNAGMV